jgi:NDP-sugar pyrophosphorylase family protein
MKAMIFAAGLGTRLRPLTDSQPKALFKINDIPLLQHVLLKLKNSGFDQIIINVHHHAEQIESFISQQTFNVQLSLSYEQKLLDTGGGLKQAAWFFEDGAPFLIHNVDVLSDIDLNKLLEHHISDNAIATLAVKQRTTSRYLLFNRQQKLIGRQAGEDLIIADPEATNKSFRALSFLGVHLVSPQLFKYFPEEKVFSILDVYLNAVGNGETIRGIIPEHTFWVDVGRKESIAKAEKLAKGVGNMQGKSDD